MNGMTSSKWLVAAGLILASACSNQTGPVGGQDKFPAQRVQDGLSVIDRVNAAPILESFRLLGGQIPGAAASSGNAARAIAIVRDLAGLASAGVGGPAAIPVIRPGILGKTMVYDAAAKKYLVAEGRAGAPKNGVRFVLYEIDAAGQPNPVKETGYSDLTDEKAASSTTAGLRLRVASGTTTYLDYRFELSGSISAATVNVEGYLSDGTERVNFNLSTTGQLFGRGGTITITGKIEVPSKSFAIDAKVVGKAGESKGNGEFDLAVTAGSDVVEISAKGNANDVNATVKVNGKLFASIKGNPANPVIKGEGGRDLTTEELAALHSVYEFAEGAFKLIGDLLAPAAALLLIGLSL